MKKPDNRNKLVKLLHLAKLNPNPHEANLALLRARQLWKKGLRTSNLKPGQLIRINGSQYLFIDELWEPHMQLPQLRFKPFKPSVSFHLIQTLSSSSTSSSTSSWTSSTSSWTSSNPSSSNPSYYYYYYSK